MKMMMTTKQMAETRGFIWVHWAGTQAKIDGIRVEGNAYYVRITRYNMCGTELARLTVTTTADDVWQAIDSPLR